MQPVNICFLSSSKTLKGSESSNNFWSLLLFFHLLSLEMVTHNFHYFSPPLSSAQVPTLCLLTATLMLTLLSRKPGVHISMCKRKDCLFQLKSFCCVFLFFLIYLSKSDNSTDVLSFPSISIGLKTQLPSSNQYIFNCMLRSGSRPGQQNKHIREGEQNHAHIQKVPQQGFGMGFGLPFYAWASHGRSNGGDAPHQARE